MVFVARLLVLLLLPRPLMEDVLRSLEVLGLPLHVEAAEGNL